LLQTLVHRKW